MERRSGVSRKNSVDVTRRRDLLSICTEAEAAQGRAQGQLDPELYRQCVDAFKAVYRTPWDRLAFWEKVLSQYAPAEV